MNRRQVLLAALSAAALSTTTLAFADDQGKGRRIELGQAWAAAVAAGEPLLVLVVPSVEYERGGRADQLGRWLADGSDADLAPLGGMQLACASLAELDRLVPGVAEARGAWLVLVRVDQPTPTWRSIAVAAVPRDLTARGFAAWASDNHLDRSTREALRAAWRRERDGDVFRGVALQVALLRQAAARVFASEGLVPGSAQDRAHQARDRWVDRPPPGARWTAFSGCGTYFEAQPGQQTAVHSIGCGMGHVERRVSARMLQFWAPSA
jgi:hypothetical protein